jgi:hypothetical protein
VDVADHRVASPGRLTAGSGRLAAGRWFGSVRAHEKELRGTDDLEMAPGGAHLVVAFAVEHVGGGAVVVLLAAVVGGVRSAQQ